MYRKPKKAISIPYAEILIDDDITLGVAEKAGVFGITIFIPFFGFTVNQLCNFIKRNKNIIEFYSSFFPKRNKTKPGKKEIIPSIPVYMLYKYFGWSINKICDFLESAYGDSSDRDYINYDSVRASIKRMHSRLYPKT